MKTLNVLRTFYIVKMKFKNLTKELDLVFGPFSEEEKKRILLAAERDFELSSKVSTNHSSDLIISLFNTVFLKKSRVVSKKVMSKYAEILKHFSIEEIETAMRNAKEDSFHKETSHKYCTIEYFSRIEQIDKWVNVKKEQEQKVYPKFNVRENG